MKKPLSQILIILLSTILISAQNTEKNLIPFDEFGTLSLGDLSARIDRLRNELQNRKDVSALIRFYGEPENWLDYPYVRKAFYETYFSNFKAINKSRIIIEFCNSQEKEVKNQFFIVPPKVYVNKCEATFRIPLKTTLIKTKVFYPVGSGDDYLGTKGIDKATTEAFYNYVTDLLKKSPTSKIYLIGYAGRYFNSSESGREEEIISKIDSLRVNDKSLQKLKNEIIKRGIQSPRVIIIRGGHRNYSKEADVWFVPKGSKIPKPRPDYFPKKVRKGK